MTEDEQQLQDHLLDLSILKALAKCGDYDPLKVTLIQAAQIVHAPRPLARDIERRLEDLDTRGLLSLYASAGGRKVSLTDKGKDFRRQHG